jgi:putative acetyltransferase
MLVHIRRIGPADRAPLLALWERSVRATHLFLTDADVVGLRPAVAAELASDAIEWWIAHDDAETPLGFMGYGDGAVEGLFIDASHRGGGVGRRLIDHARQRSGGALSVDVNEQNDAAIGFYEALGFTIVGRSPTDADGRPFPLVHMRRP